MQERNDANGAAVGKLKLEGAAGCAQREPNWHEIGLEQKVERVREALLRLESVVASSEQRSSEALKMAKAHEHGSLGYVVMPVLERNTLWDNEARLEVRHIFARLR